LPFHLAFHSRMISFNKRGWCSWGKMGDKTSCVVLDEKDNVATSLLDISAGESFHIQVGAKGLTINMRDDIPFGHKFCIKEIDVYSPIIKYGQIIGVATKGIAVGEHVHIHNVVSSRGRGDLEGDVEYEL
jgi:altronate dehydratase small subunit